LQKKGNFKFKKLGSITGVDEFPASAIAQSVHCKQSPTLRCSPCQKAPTKR